MKNILVIILLLSASSAFAVDLKNCKKFIAKNFDKINVCMQGTYESCLKGENRCKVEIRNCRSKQIQTITCDVEQSLQSSACVMEITLDEYCARPISSIVVYDGRE